MLRPTAFSFSSAPRVVLARSLWSPRKDEDEDFEGGERRPQGYNNLMHERRVVRGLTCARPQPSTQQEPEPIKPRKRFKRSWRGSRWSLQNFPPPTSRAPIPLSYAEMLDKLYPVEEEVLREMADEESQTDDFLDRPPIPEYLPVKTGVDNWAQVICSELFDFDFEVRPVLDVLLMKTVDVALQEVHEEDELANIRIQIRMLEELREADEAAKASLEEKERRIGIEKQYRVFKRRDAVEKERQLSRKIAACAYTQCCHQDMRPIVFDLLNSKGFFFDPLHRELEMNFLENVEHSVELEIEMQNFYRRYLDFVLLEVVQERRKSPEPSSSIHTQIDENSAVVESDESQMVEDESGSMYHDNESINSSD